MFYDKITICEDHLIDFSNDGFEGCVACLLYGEIKRLKNIITELKTPPEPVVDADAGKCYAKIMDILEDESPIQYFRCGTCNGPVVYGHCCGACGATDPVTPNRTD